MWIWGDARENILHVTKFYSRYIYRTAKLRTLWPREIARWYFNNIWLFNNHAKIFSLTNDTRALKRDDLKYILRQMKMTK